jgi:beta-glucosidase
MEMTQHGIGNDEEVTVRALKAGIDMDMVSLEGLRAAVEPQGSVAYVEELLPEAIAIAQEADVVIAALGENRDMSGEGASRSNPAIPESQQQLLKALLQTGKPVVLVLFTGRPLILTWEDEHVPAILNSWFLGVQAGVAIADVLFGDVNPSGKITATFPRNTGQIPIHYNHKNTGRPQDSEDAPYVRFKSNYMDVVNSPLYPFGFGLSYTQFEYSDVRLSSTTMDENGVINASVTVTNTGSRDGKEVVQLYIRDRAGSITRPVKELKGFEKVMIKAGESKEVTFTITPEQLKFYNYNLEYVAEPGDFDVMIGGNSRDVKSGSFSLKSLLR